MAAPTQNMAAPATIPVATGIGLRAPHFRDLLEYRPSVAWYEVHSENYFGAGGAPLRWLERIRAQAPISLHGVGMSLGASDELDFPHLRRLHGLIRRIEPGLVSEHLSFGSHGGRHFNDLLPLPYTEEALDHVAGRVRRVQDFLGRKILLENPSSYLEYRHSTIPEWEFLAETARRADCGILLDVNNIYVSCRNHGWNPHRYLAGIPGRRVAEVHLAGHTRNRFPGGEILIDTHNRPVSDDVWALYRETLNRIGPIPTLIEWDADLPALTVLLDEARKAQACLEACHARAA